MFILLPCIENDSVTDKEIVFPIMFNLNPADITSIEPDEKGRTYVYLKYGDPYLFNVAFSRFCVMISESFSLSLYFDREIDKLDKSIIPNLR